MRSNWDLLQEYEKGGDVIHSGEKHSFAACGEIPSSLPLTPAGTITLQVWADDYQREEAHQDIIEWWESQGPETSSKCLLNTG